MELKTKDLFQLMQLAEASYARNSGDTILNCDFKQKSWHPHFI